MFTRRAEFVRILAIAMTAICLATATSCASPKRPTPFETAEDAEDFRQSLLTDVRAIDKFANQTTEGQNISEFSLGWLVYTILVTVSSEDQQLYDFFNVDGRDLQVYLKTTFQNHPEEQIAALDAMIARTPSTLRSTARYALESLRHIPNSDEPPQVQQHDRDELAKDLTQLSAYLKKAASEVVPP